MPARSHGLSSSRTYNIWAGMLDRAGRRCVGIKTIPYYAGRNIGVADRWKKFEDFLSDMGLAPDGTSLDRIDNNRGYEPGNCRWATAKEQNRNRRDNVILTLNGRSQTLIAWCEELNLNYFTVHWRLRKKWSTEAALARTRSPYRNRSRIA